ncbi:component of the polarisome [Physocladia obscura]|uniref:Component of the polarisome n=1 Tax=Physocladia obscura TaxID=109957 RepID=A0AAD5T6I4_9FUNG|nr:component of the polarisome [Physocladia obscura]
MSSVGDQYITLRSFLGGEFLGSSEALEAQSAANEQRMGRLDSQQFGVFTIDIIDEILRRREGPQGPLYLQPRQDFHPKRNQTRQKLASLAVANFKKMAADLFFELERRYPNLIQEYPKDKSPSPEQQQQQQQQPAVAVAQSVASSTTTERRRDRGERLAPRSVATRSINNGTTVISPTSRSIDDVMNELGSIMNGNTNANSTNSSSVVASPSSAAVPTPGEGAAAGVLRDAMERMRKDNQAKLEALQMKTIELEGELAGVNASLKPAKDEADRLNRLVDEYKDEIKILKEDLSVSRKDCTELRKDLSQTRKEASEAVSEAASVRTEMSKVRQASQGQIQEVQGYKKEISDLKKSIIEAQTDTERYKKETETLRLEIANLKNQNSKQLADYVSLKADYADIKSHISDQQVLFGEVRSETTALLAEVKSLTAKNLELRAANDALVAKNEEGLKVADELAQQYDEIVRSFEALKSENEQLHEQLSNRPVVLSGNGKQPQSPVLQTTPMPILSPLSHDGVLDMGAAQEYQAAVEGLLQAVRTETSTAVLPALKKMLGAAKHVTECIEDYESVHYASTEQFAQEDRLDDARKQFSKSLAAVIASAKASIGRTGTIEKVDNSVNKLTESVNLVARLIKAKCNGGNRRADFDDEEDENNGIYTEIQGLKEFVEGQTATIVEDIQELLTTIRNNNNSNNGGASSNNPNFVKEMNGKVNSVCSIVKNLLKASHVVFAKMSDADDFKVDCEAVLTSMAAARKRLEATAAELSGNPGSKEIKQQIGTTAYDLAKLVKKLVALLDEV